jgi:hypothetical protein
LQHREGLRAADATLYWHRGIQSEDLRAATKVNFAPHAIAARSCGR